MTVTELQAVAQIFAGRLLNTAAEGTMIACVVWILLRVFSRQNSGTRFVIWLLALLAIVLLPFYGGSHLVGLRSQVLIPDNKHGKIALSSAWASYLFAAWVVGSGVMLLRLFIGLWRVRQIRRNCSQLDLTDIDPAVRGVVQDDVSHRRISLCLSDDVAVPAAIGFFQPAIVFPRWLWPQLSAEEIKVIVLHEIAHIRRWDDWTNLAQKIVKALFFFHPAVWWIENRLTLEREMACDDIVLAQTSSPRAYASSLISFAEKLHGRRGLALAQALLSRVHQMSERVAQILDVGRSNSTRLAIPALALSAAVLALALFASPAVPGIVAFEDSTNKAPTGSTAASSPAINSEPNRDSAANMTPPSLVSQAQVIPAALDLRRPVTHHQSKAAPRPRITRIVKTLQANPPVRATFVILQTTQNDAAGTAVWTFCVWTVRDSPADRKLESAIFVSSI